MLPCRMLQLIFVLLRGVLAGFRSRREVALENLVLRHQLQVAVECKYSCSSRCERAKVDPAELGATESNVPRRTRTT